MRMDAGRAVFRQLRELPSPPTASEMRSSIPDMVVVAIRSRADIGTMRSVRLPHVARRTLIEGIELCICVTNQRSRPALGIFCGLRKGHLSDHAEKDHKVLDRE